MTEVMKTENEREEEVFMTPEEKIACLESRIEVLQGVVDSILEREHEENQAKILDVDKLKDAFSTGSDYVLNAVRPVVEKYEASGKEAVEKVENKVTESPLASIAAAFGIGIALGAVINFAVRATEKRN